MQAKRLIWLLAFVLLLAPVSATKIIGTNVLYENMTFWDAVQVEDSDNITFDGVTFRSATVFNASSSSIFLRNSTAYLVVLEIGVNHTVIDGDDNNSIHSLRITAPNVTIDGNIIVNHIGANGATELRILNNNVSTMETIGCVNVTIDNNIAVNYIRTLFTNDTYIWDNTAPLLHLRNGTDAQVQNNTLTTATPGVANLAMAGYENVDICDASGNTNTIAGLLVVTEATLNLESQCNYTVPFGISISGWVGSDYYNNSAIDCAGASIFGTKADSEGAIRVASTTKNYTEGNFTITNCNFYNYTYGLNVYGSTDVTIANLTVNYDDESLINISSGTITNLVLNSANHLGVTIDGGNYSISSSTFNDTFSVVATNLTFTSPTIYLNATVGAAALDLQFNSGTWQPASSADTIYIEVSGTNNSWLGNTFTNISFVESGTGNACYNGTYRDKTYSGGAGCAMPNLTSQHFPTAPLQPKTFYFDQQMTFELGCLDQTSIASGMYNGTSLETYNIAMTVFNSTALRGLKSPNHLIGTYTIAEVACTDSDGNEYFQGSSTTFQIVSRDGDVAPATPPPPDPPAIPGGGGGAFMCPPHLISTPAGCLPGCYGGTVYSELEEACVSLERYLLEINITDVTVPFTTFPSRVDKIFLPIRFLGENSAEYLHQLTANKKLKSCHSENGEFDCKISGVNTMLLSRTFLDKNVFSETVEDVIVVEDVLGTVISVPYTVRLYNPGATFLQGEVPEEEVLLTPDAITGGVVQVLFKERGGSIQGIRLVFVLSILVFVVGFWKRKEVIKIVKGVLKQQ